MRCYCFLRNVNDVQFYGSTPYFRRYDESFKGHCIPFGAEVGYMKFDLSIRAIRDHPMHSKVHKGLFIGYDTRPGGQWSGDYYVVDAEHLAQADSIHNVRAIKIKNLIAPEYFIFPCATGALKQRENQLKHHVQLDDAADEHREILDFPSLMSEDELDELVLAPIG